MEQRRVSRDAGGGRVDTGAVHAVRFYEDSRTLQQNVARFFVDGLCAGEAAIAITTVDRAKTLRPLIRRTAPDSLRIVGGTKPPSAGELLFIDADEALGWFMRGTEPDPRLFQDRFGALIEGTLERGLPGLRVYGDMVDVLWSRGNGAGAAQLEVLWQELTTRHGFALLCAYDLHHFTEAIHAADVRRICDVHTVVHPAESWSAPGDPGVRDRELIELQRRARALETELERRMTLEVALREALDARRRTEDGLRTARDQAERAAQVKSDFLAVMSHELRTPLNAIMGYEGLLSMEVGGPVTDQQRSFLQRIRGAADQLLRLIDQILNLSRIEAGVEELQTESVEVQALVTEAASLVEPTAAAKGLVISTDAPPGLMCETDPGKLRQILLNLLANGVKFTSAGTVSLEVSADEGDVVFAVRDTGIGIPEHQLERVFEPFVQVDGTTTRRSGGIGLGLSVSRDLARLLGGEITVASRPGRGSVFTLRLPAGRCSPGDAVGPGAG